MDEQAVAGHALEPGADLFGYPLTRNIAHGHDDLDARQSQFLETERSQRAGRHGSQTLGAAGKRAPRNRDCRNCARG